MPIATLPDVDAGSRISSLAQPVDTEQRQSSKIRQKQQADRQKRLHQRREEMVQRSEKAMVISRMAATEALSRNLLSTPARPEGHFETNMVIRSAIGIVTAPCPHRQQLAQALGHQVSLTEVSNVLTAIDLFVARKTASVLPRATE